MSTKIYTETTSDGVILPIYYNVNDSITTPYKLNEYDLRSYINNYNGSYNTNYNFGQIVNEIKNKKSNPNRLHKNEYMRHGEIKHIENFCINSTFNNNLLNISPKKKNILRLISYNVHSFMQTCDVFDKTSDGYFQSSIANNDINNTNNILSLIRHIEPDFICLQEFSPYPTPTEPISKLKNFYDSYNINEQNKPLKSFVTTYLDDANVDIKNLPTFIGNMILSTHNMVTRNSFNTFGNYQSNSTPRGHVYSKINYDGDDIYLFCVHPSAEGKPFLEYNKTYHHKKVAYGYDEKTLDNKIHIEGIIHYIINELKLDPKLDTIIISGDFNTNKLDNFDIFMKNSFINSKDVYSESDNYAFTGYHEVYIDNIFLSYGFMNKYRLNFNKIINVGYSDHYPIVIEFKKKEQNFITQFTGFSVMRANEIKVLFKNNIQNYIKSAISSHFIDIHKFLEEYGYINNMMTINKGTYLLHSTKSIALGDWKNIPFELQESNHPESYYWAKSTVLAHNPIESFASYYGQLDEITPKRFIIYKVKRDIPLINLYNADKNSHVLAKRHLSRLDFYRNLISYIKKNTYIDINFYPVEIGFINSPLQYGSDFIELNHMRTDNIQSSYVGYTIVIYNTEETSHALGADKLLVANIIDYNEYKHIVRINQRIDIPKSDKKYFYALFTTDDITNSKTNNIDNAITRDFSLWISSMIIIQSLSLLTLSNYMTDEGNYNKNIFFGTIISDMIQIDDYVPKPTRASRQINTYGDEWMDGIEFTIFMPEYFLEYEGTYYNGTFYSPDEWRMNYQKVLKTIEENKSLGIYRELNFRFGKNQPSNIDYQRFALKLMIDYYKYVKWLLSHPKYSNINAINNVSAILKRVIPQQSKLRAFNDNYFYVNFIINDLLDHLLNIKYTAKITQNYHNSNKLQYIDLDTMRINSASQFINNDVLREILYKYIQHRRKKSDVTPVKYMNDLLSFGLCYLLANNYIDPPILILLNMIDMIKKNQIDDISMKKCFLKSNITTDINFNEQLNSDYNVVIHVPSYNSRIINNTSVINAYYEKNKDGHKQVRQYGGDIRYAMKVFDKIIERLIYTAHIQLHVPPPNMPRTQSAFFMPIISMAYLLYTNSDRIPLSDYTNIVSAFGRIINLRAITDNVGEKIRIIKMLVHSVLTYIDKDEREIEDKLRLLEGEYLRDKEMSTSEGHVNANIQEKILDNSYIDLAEYQNIIQSYFREYIIDGKIDARTILEIMIQNHYFRHAV